MNPAYSVILFTTLSGAGYGLLALLGLVAVNHGPASSPGFAWASVLLGLVLVTAGLLFSTLHLGHPERAWRAFSQWRSSWLSREGVLAVATYPVSIAFGLVWSGSLNAPAILLPLSFILIGLCAATVFCTAMIYRSLRTIRQWNHKLVVPVYLLFALASGACVLPAVAYCFGRFQVFQSIFGVAALVALGAVKFTYWKSVDAIPRTHTTGEATGLGQNTRMWELPHTSRNFVQQEMGYMVARKHAVKLRKLVFVALLTAALLLALGAVTIQFLGMLAVLPVMLAAFVERWLFFAEAEHASRLYYSGAPI